MKKVNKYMSKDFKFFLGVALSFFISLPAKTFANKKEIRSDNTFYSYGIKPYFETPFDGANPSERISQEMSYPTSWYDSFDSTLHLEETGMTYTGDKFSEFIESAGHRIEVSRQYQDVVNEIFFRSTMMFRLAKNGYSTAYVKELDTIFQRFAELDSEMKKLKMGIKSRKSELDRVIEAALLVGIHGDGVISKNFQAQFTVKEVLSTITDFANRKDYRSDVLKQSNALNSTIRFSSGFSFSLVFFVVSSVWANVEVLDDLLKISMNEISMGTALCSVVLGPYVSRWFFPMKFKCSQKHVFDQVAQKCSNLLNQLESTSETVPRGRQ